MKKLLWLLPVVVIFALIPYFSIYHFGLSENPDNWSAFGSYTGGVISPIVAIIAILFVYRDLLNQQKTQQKQEEQNNFFKLLEFFNHVRFEVMEATYFEQNEKGEDTGKTYSYRGVKCVIFIVTHHFVRLRNNQPIKLNCEQALAHIYKKHQYCLNMYFNVLEEMLKYVEKEGREEKEKKISTALPLVNAHIAPYEKFLIKHIGIHYEETSFPLIFKYREQLTNTEDFKIFEDDKFVLLNPSSFIV